MQSGHLKNVHISSVLYFEISLSVSINLTDVIVVQCFMQDECSFHILGKYIDGKWSKKCKVYLFSL